MKTIIAVLGDSISAGTPGWDPNPVTRAQSGRSNKRSQWQYWAQQSHPELEFRNFGVNLETTEQIARRLDDAAVGADWIVIQGGINDVVGRISPDETVANLRGMVKRSSGKRLAVMLAEILPWNKGYDGSESIIRQLNARIRQLGRDESVQVLPFYQTLDDPDSTGQMRPEWTDDGNHPSQPGHRRLGEIAFSWPAQPTMEAI